MRARVQSRLSASGVAEAQAEVEAQTEADEQDYVTVLAQKHTRAAFAVLLREMRSGDTSATRVRAALGVLEWGWIKPSSPAAAGRRAPIGNDGGRGFTVVINSAVTPGVGQEITLVAPGGEESRHALPAPPIDVPVARTDDEEDD